MIVTKPSLNLHVGVLASRNRPRKCCSRLYAQSNEFEDYVLDLQQRIIQEAESLEPTQRFLIDKWDRAANDPNAGYGITAVLEDGDVLEKAAANITIVRGRLSAERAKAMSSRGRASIDPNGGQPYAAAAMSLVFHTRHPFVPTLRADVRVFEVNGDKWFGGGCDLTPAYLVEEDVIGFHRHWHDLCAKHDGNKVEGKSGLYREYKKWCDEYFYIPTRKEVRGVGGLFFDDLATGDGRVHDAEAFVRNVGDNILPSWLPIVAKRQSMATTERHREWQLLRRGRYIEFNLLVDRGIKFGLEGGRIESIMVSAPPLVRWKYKVEPAVGSEEHRMMEVLRKPRDWV